jgi:superfamily I DNA/RNA helicase
VILNPQQTAAVHSSGHSVVVACPGSGKTRVLVEKTIRLRRADPDATIILVTFTRQAAMELQKRVKEKLASLANVRISTFHSLALQQLLLSQDIRICGPSEQLALLRQAAAAYLPDKRFREFQTAVDAYTSGAMSALDQPEYQSAYDTYLDLLTEYTAVDFGHSILQASNGMDAGRLNPFPCQYLLVDEVQDIDPTQIRWVIGHTRNGAQLTVVGDDDQSIYGWRQATGYRGIQKLRRELAATVINLSINYRSHREVLGLSSKLIDCNRYRVPKNLYSARGSGGSVSLHSKYWTDLDELEGLSSHVVRSGGKWAVIARSNRQLDRLAIHLRDLNIKYSRPGRAQFWESEEPSLFLKLLRPNPLNDPLLRATILSRAGGTDSGNARQALKTLQQTLLRHPITGSPSSRINAVSNWLTGNLNGIAKNRRDTLIQVVELCRDYMNGMSGNLQSRIDKASRPRSTKEEDITLLTMHGAKGLEYDSVWIIGCQDGTIPNSRTDDIEEERRLLYVAMTRAEKDLHLSFAWNRVVTRSDGSCYLRTMAPSRFISEDLKLPLPERSYVQHEHPGVYIN